jgi:hypothetical protein
VKLENRLNI